MSAQVSYFEKFAPLAFKVAKNTNVHPQTLLALSYYESGRGLSELAKKYNNYFGIKAGNEWKGKKVNFLSDETTGARRSDFRVYASPEDSFKDFVKFLNTYSRYKPALTALNWQEQIIRLAASGYAGNPTWKQAATKQDLIKILNRVKPALKSLGAPAQLIEVGIFTAILLNKYFQANDKDI